MKRDKEFKNKYEIDFIKMLKSKVNIFNRRIKLEPIKKVKDNMHELSISTNKLITYFTEVFYHYFFVLYLRY